MFKKNDLVYVELSPDLHSERVLDEWNGVEGIVRDLKFWDGYSNPVCEVLLTKVNSESRERVGYVANIEYINLRSLQSGEASV